MVNKGPAGLRAMKKQSKSILKGEEKNLIANSIRKYILRDLLKYCSTSKAAKRKFKEVKEGRHDDLVDEYLDELEVLIKAKLKERSYWRI